MISWFSKPDDHLWNSGQFLTLVFWMISVIVLYEYLGLKTLIFPQQSLKVNVQVLGFIARLVGVWLQIQGSQVQPHNFSGDWAWNIFYSHSPSSIDSRRAVVSYWPKYVHKVLVEQKSICFPGYVYPFWEGAALKGRSKFFPLKVTPFTREVNTFRPE